MKRLAASILLICILFVSPVLGHDWSGVFDRVKQSVVQLFHDKGNCTAFSINQQSHYYLTAFHCLGNNMAFWKESSTSSGMQHTFNVLRVMKMSKQLDLAVLEAEEGMPALLKGKMPREGAEVASIGYAFGEDRPYIFTQHVAHIKEARSYDILRKIIIKDQKDIGGMSGGPVVDIKGNVVSMVQFGAIGNGGDDLVDFGTAIEDIYKFAKDFWEK